MRRLVRFALPSMCLVVSACGRTTFRWQPSLVTHVPDSTPVRFALDRGTPRTVGRSLDWRLGRPRVVTTRGDTVVVPQGATLEVKLKDKANRAVAGAIIGFVAGAGLSYALCDPPKTHCGEEDPTQLLTAGLGALIGSAIKTDHWVRVRWR